MLENLACTLNNLWSDLNLFSSECIVECSSTPQNQTLKIELLYSWNALNIKSVINSIMMLFT